ncbi:MAG: hypothetical protein OXJ52_07450, partial [Oligoflexia bacterium]|nr:hypothetical protein [Oligoflexia bacterium]
GAEASPNSKKSANKNTDTRVSIGLNPETKISPNTDEGAEASPNANKSANKNARANTDTANVKAKEITPVYMPKSPNLNTSNTSENSNSKTGASPNADKNANTNIKTNTDSSSEIEISSNAGANINRDQKTAGRAMQEHTDFNVESNLIQKEICENFSKADWINPDFSVRQSIQHFTKKQMQNLLSINREFPSSQDKETEIRCFVKTAFSLNKILKITTGRWRKGAQAPLRASHKKILIEFIEHYFTAWIGYSMLLPVKSIPSEYIHFVVKEPYLLKNKLYKIVTKFDIMSFRSIKILWIVDSQSFPKELAFLDIIIDGISALYLLRDQMYYLFKQKNGNMDTIVSKLQNKMDNSSFADL